MRRWRPRWEWLAVMTLAATAIGLARYRRPQPKPLKDCWACLASFDEKKWIYPLLKRFRDELLAGRYDLWKDPRDGIANTPADWTARDKISYTFNDIYALKTGLVGQLTLHGPRGQQFQITPLFIKGPEAPELWTSLPPAAFAGIETTAQQVTARIDPARKWMAVDVELRLRGAGSPTAVFEVPRFRGLEEAAEQNRLFYEETLPNDRGLDLTELTVGGERPWFGQFQGELAVQLPAGANDHRISFHYQGVPDDEHNLFLGDTLALREWFPLSKAGDPEVELTVRLPRSHMVLGLGSPATSSDRSDGWSESTWKLPASAARAGLMIAPRATAEERAALVKLDGAELRILGEDVERVGPAVEAAARAVQRLRLPLPPRLDVVQAHEDGVGQSAIFLHVTAAQLHMVAITRWRIAALLVAHAYAQRVGDACDRAMPASASVAMALAWLALDEPQRKIVAHTLWLAESGSVDLPVALAVSPCVWTDSPRAIRGARILLALAHRVGEAALVEVLRELAVPGAKLSWARVSEQVGAKAGAEESRWLERWLAASSLPEPALTRERLTSGGLRLKLSTTIPAAYGEQVPVVFYRGARELGRATAELEESLEDQRTTWWRDVRGERYDEGARAPRRPIIPPQTDRIVLDPELTSLLRFPTVDGVTVRHAYSAELVPL